MTELVEVTSGLEFPEGPIAMPDGSVILVEMFGPRLTRVLPDGTKETVAEVPGGPNGAALGPDGAIYVANNGARFTKTEMEGLTFPGPTTPGKYIGGRISRVDVETGDVTDLYTQCNGVDLVAPNDLVFDDQGGFYFTDHGRDEGRVAHLGGIYYAKADGSSIEELVFPAHEPNGIGLSPDGTILYWAETWTGRVMRRRVLGPGQLEEAGLVDTWQCLYGLPGFQLLDSLGVDGDGNVCVATLVNGGVTVISPDGELVDFIESGDLLTTNICFGGDALKTAYVTLSGTGRLMRMEWPRPGAKLHYLND
ncbi:MAG: SMP-30/gluconolactonase/LRE family protein [Ilumatobacter sp.]